MALPAHALKLLAPHLRGADVLSLGFPDILATPEEIKRIFGYKPTRFSDENLWHAVEHPLPDTLELFENAGARLEVVDYKQERGMETVADLNYPQTLGAFDLVLDPGTIEHCFNVGQALLNAAGAVKPGGRIFHLSPMTMVNHGFYNICPTLYFDFYTQNDWLIEEIAMVPITHVDSVVTERMIPAVEYLLRALAQRKTATALKVPMQSKYISKPRVLEKLKKQRALQAA